jgi:hypothetical protein
MAGTRIALTRPRRPDLSSHINYIILNLFSNVQTFSRGNSWLIYQFKNLASGPTLIQVAFEADSFFELITSENDLYHDGSGRKHNRLFGVITV